MFMKANLMKMLVLYIFVKDKHAVTVTACGTGYRRRFSFRTQFYAKSTSEPACCSDCIDKMTGLCYTEDEAGTGRTERRRNIRSPRSAVGLLRNPQGCSVRASVTVGPGPGG